MKNLKYYFALLATISTFSLFGWQMDCCSQDTECCPVECAGDWFFEADWIYAKTHQEGLDFAQLLEPVIIDPTTTNITYTNLKFKDKWESGFRVRGAYRLPCYGWDLGVAYTYIPGKATLGPVISELGSFIIPTAPELFFVELITAGDAAFSNVSAEWKSKLNYLDVDLSNRFTICNNVILAPRFGLRFLWLKEDVNIDTIGAVGTLDIFPSFIFKQHEKFHSVGIMAGLKGCWDIGYGLSIVGDVSGSLLYGRFRMKNSALAAVAIVEPGAAPIVDLTTFYNKETERRIIPTIDYTLGLRFASCMCDINYFIRVDWFEQILLDVNQFARYGNLSSQGLVLGGGFTF